MQCSYSQLLVAVHRCADLLYAHGGRRRDALELISSNCAGLVAVTLANNQPRTRTLAGNLGVNCHCKPGLFDTVLVL